MSGKKFKFSEIINQPTVADEKYNAIERQIKALTERLDKIGVINQDMQEKPVETVKTSKKGIITNV